MMLYLILLYSVIYVECFFIYIYYFFLISKFQHAKLDKKYQNLCFGISFLLIITIFANTLCTNIA